jgi:hypothetical protein
VSHSRWSHTVWITMLGWLLTCSVLMKDCLLKFSDHCIILCAQRITRKLRMMVFIKIMGVQPIWHRCQHHMDSLALRYNAIFWLSILFLLPLVTSDFNMQFWHYLLLVSLSFSHMTCDSSRIYILPSDWNQLCLADQTEQDLAPPPPLLFLSLKVEADPASKMSYNSKYSWTMDNVKWNNFITCVKYIPLCLTWFWSSVLFSNESDAMVIIESYHLELQRAPLDTGTFIKGKTSLIKLCAGFITPVSKTCNVRVFNIFSVIYIHIYICMKCITAALLEFLTSFNRIFTVNISNIFTNKTYSST